MSLPAGRGMERVKSWGLARNQTGMAKGQEGQQCGRSGVWCTVRPLEGRPLGLVGLAFQHYAYSQVSH